MNRRLILLAATAFVMASASALADDKTPPQPIDQQKLKEERAKAKAEKEKANGGFLHLPRKQKAPDDASPPDAYGTAPMRTPKGTPLVGDFDEKGQPGKRGQTKALPPKGGFGAPGGREQEKALRDGANQRDELQREQSRKAWDAKYGPEKAPGQ